MRLVLSVLLLIASTISASATVVPEIDAYSGLAAMAAVGSIASLLWERRRGRKH